MTTASEHLAKYPNARGTTLAFLIQRDKKNEELRADIERRIDRLISTAFRTFPINIKRQYERGKL